LRLKSPLVTLEIRGETFEYYILKRFVFFNPLAWPLADLCSRLSAKKNLLESGAGFHEEACRTWMASRFKD
jgi:hypothetical protein